MEKRKSPRRILPVSTQEFSVVREDGLVYVDKTDLVWEMANAPENVVFFSRPRRFGKTMLLSTLEAYFLGQKELFEGLKIIELETEWRKYEVLRFDLSGCTTAKTFESKLNLYLGEFEERYGVEAEGSVGDRLHRLIFKASKGKRNVVVLVDEYDYSLQHTLFDDSDEHEKLKSIYRDFFAVLKTQSRYIKYIFLTGITKFTNLSLFSVLNNINTISYWPQYQSICGITKEELRTTLRPDVQAMAEALGMTEEETIEAITAKYDGYHFCENGIDIYNPFSLIRALNQKQLEDFWISSGGTKMLMDAVDRLDWKETDLDNIKIAKAEINSSDVNKSNLALFLYQSGYLTIKGATVDDYILGIPNSEVRRAMYDQILPRLVRKDEISVASSIRGIRDSLRLLDVNKAMASLQSLVAETPYARDNSARAMEDKFQFITKNAMFLAGCMVREEVHVARGRIDLVCEHKSCVLIMELKMTNNGGIQSAEEQIETRDYASAYKSQSKPLYTVAVEFNTDDRCMTGYSVKPV